LPFLQIRIKDQRRADEQQNDTYVKKDIHQRLFKICLPCFHPNKAPTSEFSILPISFFLDEKRNKKIKNENQPPFFRAHAYPGNGVKKWRFALFVHASRTITNICSTLYQPVYKNVFEICHSKINDNNLNVNFETSSD
jgi:hypothetical protein